MLAFQESLFLVSKLVSFIDDIIVALLALCERSVNVPETVGSVRAGDRHVVRSKFAFSKCAAAEVFRLKLLRVMVVNKTLQSDSMRQLKRSAISKDVFKIRVNGCKVVFGRLLAE